MRKRNHPRKTRLKRPESMDIQEQWKEDQWNYFMNKTEDDWVEFNKTMDDLISSWFQKKELEWDAWIRAMKNRWEYYNKNMDEYVLEVIKRSLKWTDSQWKKWIKVMKKKSMKPFGTSGDEYILDVFQQKSSWTTEQWKEWINTPIRECMDKDWEYWIDEDQYKLANWMMDNFDKWVSKRIMEWEQEKWKTEENEYWANWEAEGSGHKSRISTDRKNWNLWKERTDREQKQWNMSIEQKRNEFLNKDVVPWIKWKSEKTKMFEDWKERTLGTWIKEKQWYVWLNKKKLVCRRKLY
ncbi:hypothetical protein C922_04420 [Plasmodium inui San Antonio 1]|uniref:Tryptophan/threonine-rich plasmodium antigen C-terminal domain-containing protein n=1 Tax=Plasmodium inui San Antonio 1 TaxID=1237626 RepID=W7A7P2_9APIC|nr:hypothetical protein C922_04420 [Plasmodium inui San Antonio 1]EUD65134.1 hypothetical protein C922_04420 [Plasmodium inui San Antonio 1]